jgi:hypothetical protein
VHVTSNSQLKLYTEAILHLIRTGTVKYMTYETPWKVMLMQIIQGKNVLFATRNQGGYYCPPMWVYGKYVGRLFKDCIFCKN